MSKEQSTSGDTSATSGAENGNGSATSGAQSYPADFVEKLKKEKENLAKANLATKQELESLKAASQQREQQELEQKQEFKKLYEAEKAKSESAAKELAAMQERIKQATINTAIRSELVKRGLDEAHVETALKLVDRQAVAVDPATNAVVGADEVAKKFHEAHATLGFFKKGGAGVNHAASQTVVPGQMDLSKMTVDEKIKLLSERRKGT